MKTKLTALAVTGALLLGLCACSTPNDPGQTDAPAQTTPTAQETATPAPTSPVREGEVLITLSDESVTVLDNLQGDASPVRLGDGIIYYQDGTDETYGEGTADEMHSAEEAEAHQVVTITQPGIYRLTGKLSKGQIFVDLGEDAKRDPNAVVTLILDNADVTCTVAPALLFYRVYECDEAWVAYDEGETDAYEGSPNADTSKAGANVIIAAGSRNNFTGSHVARIYKEGTTKKLHKYDGAFYSKMSMNIDGDSGNDSGVLNIVGDNEGLNSELHLSINGGTVDIQSMDDGINTNEDNVSVTTVNGGVLNISAGLGAEGDGIDSNGYLTFNGGVSTVTCNETSPDGGIDADCAITLNGGTVAAFGNMNGTVDRGSKAAYLQLTTSGMKAGSTVAVKDGDGNVVWEDAVQRACTALTLTTPELKQDGDYRLYVDGTEQQSGGGFGMGGFGGGLPGGMERPEGMQPGQMPDNMTPPEGMELPEGFDPGQMPEGFERPEGMEPPEGFDPSQMGGQRPAMT